jgi:Na+-transporting NADH:ubiquinone oxidoreductase subunit C
MKNNGYTLLYAAIIGTLCSVIPTAIGNYTAPFREANAKADELRNILRVLDIPLAPKTSPKELVTFFEKKVSIAKKRELQEYVAFDEHDSTVTKAIAVPFAGPGIWGPIRGFLALEPDMKTIRGITFSYHEETPGLGGEISSEAFRRQFRGKSIVDPSGRPGFHIRRTGGGAINEVDGISGATLTCGKVDAILNALASFIDQEQSHAR